MFKILVALEVSGENVRFTLFMFITVWLDILCNIKKCVVTAVYFLGF